MSSKVHIPEPSRFTPIAAEVDVCVIGGGCSGVFAAVRAARLGCSVAIVETLGQFGGAATSRMVNVWHSLWNTSGEQQIIGGLTLEIMTRLRQRGAIIEREKTNPDWQFCFNSAELACELDLLLGEAGIRCFLHARAVAAPVDGGEVQAVIIEDKSGRRGIRARQFVDASGDADLVFLAGGSAAIARRSHLQPPTMAGILDGVERKKLDDPSFHLGATVFDKSNPYHLDDGFLWAAPLPGSPTLNAVFGTRVKGVDCSDGDQLTRAEMEGRGQLRQIIDALCHAYGGDDHQFNMVALPACIGIRDTRHAICEHKITESEVLNGIAFDDAIAFGTYRVDVHHQQEAGITFRYLDGRESIRYTDGKPSVDGRWRPEIEEDPTYYQVPLRSLKPKGLSNVLVAGRCIDADIGAFGAIRVMVNCNQMGEAAGVAATLGCEQGIPMQQVSAATLRQRLAAGGSVIPGLAD